MKILHVADLHFGKTLAGQDLNEDQRDWCNKFVELVKTEKPSAVLIAGDVYDRATPNGDAVDLLDGFLTSLLAVDDHLHVMIVAGNHDSGQRLAFGSRIFKKERLHIVGKVSEKMECVTLQDENGPVNFWLMPYLFPAAVAEVLGIEERLDYTESVRRLLANQQIDISVRNVLVAHQSVMSDGTSPEEGGSETMVGGVGAIDGVVFDAFDYVALGHIHRGQVVGRDVMRYAGSPLCYHFDELKCSKKGAVAVVLAEKGKVAVEVKLLAPLHPLREIRKSYADIVAEETANECRGEYVKIVLTDQRVSPQVSDALHAIFAGKGSVLLELTSDFAAFSDVRGDGVSSARERKLEEKLLDFWRDRHGGEDPDAAMTELIKIATRRPENGGWKNDDAIEAILTQVKGMEG